jgi:hypothetical protein
MIADLGRTERRVAATRYVTGLLLPGQRNPSNRWPPAWPAIRNP